MYENLNKGKKTEKIPEDIIKISREILGFFPSIIETDFYTIDLLNNVLKTNKIVWSEKYFNGVNTIYNKGLIKLESNILIYFKKREDENSYKFFCLLHEESTDSIVFYFNQHNKYKTIT
jgi:hypothetical protein